MIDGRSVRKLAVPLQCVYLAGRDELSSCARAKHSCFMSDMYVEMDNTIELPDMKPKHPDLPLVVGSSIGHNPLYIISARIWDKLENQSTPHCVG